MPSNRQEIQQYLTTGTYNITVPSGFSSNVVVYAWGAGGGAGHARGGAGGFVKSIVNIDANDTVIVSVGGPGGNDPGSESRPYSTVTTGRRNMMSGGEGYYITGASTTTYSANVTTNPGSQANGFFVASTTGSTDPNNNSLRYILRLNSETIWDSVSPPGPEFTPGTYVGTSSQLTSTSDDAYQLGVPAGTNYYYNVFNLVNKPNYNFNGGDGAPQSDPEDGDAGPSGGGGAASVILINGVPKVVAAGGGGGGGYGEDGAGGATVGGPGGLANTTVTSSSKGQNGNTRGGGGSGGGGAGYPYGGATGVAYGDDAQGSQGGHGGQNYNGGYSSATIDGEVVTAIVQAGSSAGTPGGLTDALYPGSKRGYPGTPGAVILVFTREFTGWIKDSGNWKQITDAYVKTSEPTPGVAVGSRSFGTLGSNVFKVPAGVTLVTVSYPTADGMRQQLLSVVPGQNLNIELGDYGAPSRVGTLTIPAYSKKVFDYKGNVDHLTSMDIQVVAASAITLTTSGNNSTQTAAATAQGLTLTYTYEGWHGDLSSTIVMTPAASSTIFNSVQVVAGGGGRAQGPSVTAQPTSPNYIMSGQIYDTAGGEGYYDINFTLQQRGYVTISYDQPIMVSGWKRIIRGWIKDSNEWKPISAGGSVTSDLISSAPGGVEAGPTINLSLYTELLNYNLYGAASIRGYVPGKTTINLTIDANATIGSESVTIPALLVSGFKSGDRINITNYGMIAGAGGRGGTGLDNGQDGGIGLFTDSTLTIDNRGTIQGGGGGGAGVVRYGLATATSKYPTATYAGGGGAGLKAGTSGSPGRDTEGISTGSALSGNLVVGGTGTYGNNSGGNPGAAGNVYADYGSSLGGAAGAAVYGNTFVTWSNVGTIKGSRV